MFLPALLLAMLSLAACARPVEPRSAAVSKTGPPAADAVDARGVRDHTGAAAAVTTDRSSYVLIEGAQGPEATIGKVRGMGSHLRFSELPEVTAHQAVNESPLCEPFCLVRG